MNAPPENRLGELRSVAETHEIAALSLVGDFDLANAPAIVEECQRLLAGDNHLILDLSAATFIDSSVIHALFRASSEARKHDRVAVLQLGTAPIVERVLEISCIERTLPRVSTRHEAIDTIHELQHRAGDLRSATAADGS